MNNMNKKYRCCISAEPDKGSFTKNMTFTEVETIQRKQVENEEWFKKVESEHKSALLHQKNGKRQNHSARQPQKGGKRNTQRHNNAK